MTLDNLVEYIKTKELGTCKENEEAKNYCSVKVGGTLRAVYFPNNIEDLIEVLKLAKENSIKFKILGKGSNIIFENKFFDILFIKFSNILEELEIEDNIVRVESGFPFKKLAKVLSKQGLKGLEYAGGIPASVGGAIYMNAGAHLQQISDIIQEVTFLDENFDIRILKKEDCEFDYRKSIFQKKDYVIVEAVFKMEKGDKAEIFKKMSGNLEYRKEMQPLSYPSFGSVFKNPQGYHVGKIVDELGIKGKQIGGAMVSLKHGNFIVNVNDATAEDVIKLIDYIKDEVKKEYNITLQTEVEIFKG